ncbi:MAG TPA: hypothetical protein VG942_17775 [Hyphomonadaceae bacterium]|nr:hypothetical protein [Hyphomonadaceae bacterium]
MTTPSDPKLPANTQHEPRVPGDKRDETEPKDPPGKPFRTPNKTKTHPAPQHGTDGEPRPAKT